LAQIFKKWVPNHVPEHLLLVHSDQGRVLAPIFGDLSHKLSKIKSPLEKCSRAADQDLLINLF
jgi:hypothetical protein